ncbi:hypothetical protein SLS60_009875 [Paraconiothyrium brasiliense]|uniref:C3H1-type domain-containing protein n=1 Tax=Paraconiothyrium brasiliense TaxID=300254 RepID=A0ABR3QSQ3_9PLEO
MDKSPEINIAADLFKTTKGKAAFRYLEWIAKELNVQPPLDGGFNPIAVHNNLRGLIDREDNYRKDMRKAEEVLGISKLGITLDEISKLSEPDYPTHDLKSGQGLLIELSNKTIDTVKGMRPVETEFVIEEEPQTKSREPPTPQRNWRFTKDNLLQNPNLAMKTKRKVPTSRHSCLQMDYHEMKPAEYDPCNRNTCPYVHEDQREYCNSREYQRAVNQGEHKEWPPWSKIPYGKRPTLVQRDSAMDKKIDALKRKGKDAGVDQEAQDAKKLKLEEDEHEDLLNLPLNGKPYTLGIPKKDMPMKVRRPDGHMILTWSDKAIQKLEAFRQEASRKEEDTADKKGETNNEEVAADEEGTTEKRGA